MQFRHLSAKCHCVINTGVFLVKTFLVYGLVLDDRCISPPTTDSSATNIRDGLSALVMVKSWERMVKLNLLISYPYRIWHKTRRFYMCSNSSINTPKLPFNIKGTLDITCSFKPKTAVNVKLHDNFGKLIFSS